MAGPRPTAIATAGLCLVLVAGARIAGADGQATPDPVAEVVASGADVAADAAVDGAADGAPGPTVEAGPSAGWEVHAPLGVDAIAPPRPAPVRVAEDLGAVDPSTFLHGAPWLDMTPAFRDRRFTTPPNPWLPDPVDGAFVGSVHEVPAHVALRSTWHEDCPVTLDELRWVKVTHVGFDGLAHGGELLVHRDVAEGVVAVFRRLYEARYPIEKMRIAGRLDTSIGPWWHGDDNTTTSFVCRRSTASSRWSEHAYGLAIDVNPYHNPYLRRARTPGAEDVLIPPGSVHYLERDDRPGIIHQHDQVWSAFDEELGWYWGGQWSSALDYMHFSWNDR